ncbi:phosphatase PAP2 family protein [Kineococcus aurantiacus]|uniref:Undecaprenyl-diphosphatase n=1 Tax=Kineococcus aurantiacus TaxID=37633 RepID=A0A7Y9ASL4_9ACTN|nr:phosphatase PAP2 family protein [Kineococcus aurantiacus]NYD20841.1 undecaprenyl-diphosphatase [Kineococcus aurantiacus]
MRLALACAAGFAALTVLVVVGEVPGDGAVSAAAVRAAQADPGLTRVAQVVEAVTQPVWVYLAGFVGVVAAHRAGRRRRARAALLAGAVASVASPVVKALTDRPRPALEAGLTTASGGSFPSGHVVASTTVVLVVAVLLVPRARRGAVLAVGAVEVALVAVDRVWLGAHWPTDVLGGWLLAGALVGAAAWWADRSERDGDRPGAALGAHRGGGGGAGGHR